MNLLPNLLHTSPRTPGTTQNQWPPPTYYACPSTHRRWPNALIREKLPNLLTGCDREFWWDASSRLILPDGFNDTHASIIQPQPINTLGRSSEKTPPIFSAEFTSFRHDDLALKCQAIFLSLSLPSVCLSVSVRVRLCQCLSGCPSVPCTGQIHK